MKKLLTQVMFGRNDNYLGNFKQRLELAVNYTCKSIEKSGNLDAFELLICDWNSETPLREAVNLNEAARKCTFFIEVPPEIFARHATDTFMPGLPTGVNTGIRRAQGEFIMVTPADVLFPHASVVNLFSLLRGEVTFPADITDCYIGVERYLIPWQASERLREEDLDRYFLLHTTHMKLGYRFHGLAGAEGAHLMSKKFLHSVRGFYEKYTRWGAQEVDLARRMAQTAPQLKATLAGVYCYDLQQRPWLRTDMERQGNIDTCSLDTVRNDEKWGLGTEYLPRVPAAYCPDIVNTAPPPAPYDNEGQTTSLKPVEALDFAGKRWRTKLEQDSMSAGWEAGQRLLESACAAVNEERHINLRLAFETLLHAWLRNRTDQNTGGGYCSGWYGAHEEIVRFFDYAFTQRVHEFSEWDLPSACAMIATLATVGRQRAVNFYHTPTRKRFLAQSAAFVDPTLEITGYDHWQDKPEWPQLFRQMEQVDFLGYYHLQTGPMETAIPRLAQTQLVGGPYGSLFLDLDYLRPIVHLLDEQLPLLLGDTCSILLFSKAEGGVLHDFGTLLERKSFTLQASLPHVLVYLRQP